ncbi:MAG TPA: UDP-N-acetylmuramoyl-L-alanine--D-glutamate ligase [Fermentimonas caenicola]|jgi:UDP-N-acetylmuramoylalanine--D-glutamate ligase|uniref:UDP-N-acetylmuramoylalanine--D-glutamate ligase n=1 Tax=Fermentimonas caenicola TaxID=1562970 RepID=A0A098BXV5_9BACT|nr:UDP-N-acetylmuramoyl-L-alanine--D-glutamate ligase [Lascolabacillus sp.]MBP6174890.1 UDP-N-acetylmuramoyl-L-alanine--D-glutamate ligase [Fermentimonas sp.]MDI9625413.1 UDP-N-acetylmuramoyl-L-alanine--D-glutamate ligase [Bacteroidota bacterium]TAH61536.1 MAG: UDP-N-acetylmuramoyl-L-alanine--D-glutamate ligase [Fermentimonas caenicola]MBP6196757.1 UDP-N-acetylmuramoyl-L-alanine--D-glutamate ligase [Fermentimonas sp.]MBP7103679.1 UDP-N-acetylmuramoyl-L-alanine--D-glutamate ligase [Fermentimona
MNEKLIVVLGGGESGVGTAILAKKMGFKVFLSDSGIIKDKYRDILNSHNINFEENSHTKDIILKADEVVKSPGIPDTSLIVQELKEKGTSIISEIEFASRYTSAKLICVTGSNGKTTTVNLIYHILKSAGLNVGLCGNVGNSFALQVAEKDFDYYVLELSSFQLEGLIEFRADIAVLLNITPDHLDRYNNDMQEYINAKMRIIRNQRVNDSFIYWEDDPIVTREIEKLKPEVTCYPFGEFKKEHTVGYTENGKLFINTKGNMFNMELELLALEGMHNVYNSLASGIVAKLMDITDDQLRISLSDFQGVPHRLEKVATVRGVQYINDSKATNVNSCWYALKSMRSKTVLILGGTDKGNDYSEIDDLVRSKARALIFLGKDNSKLHTFFDGKVEEIRDASSMKEAVDLAYKLAQKGDVVLLSPCCASFDLFKNYEDRGDQFKECVRNL